MSFTCAPSNPQQSKVSQRKCCTQHSKKKKTKKWNNNSRLLFIVFCFETQTELHKMMQIYDFQSRWLVWMCVTVCRQFSVTLFLKGHKCRYCSWKWQQRGVLYTNWVLLKWMLQRLQIVYSLKRSRTLFGSMSRLKILHVDFR